MQKFIRVISIFLLMAMVAAISPSSEGRALAMDASGPSHSFEGSSGSDGTNISTARRTQNLIPYNANCPRFMGDDDLYDKVDDFRENRATLQEEYALGFAEWLWNLFGLNTLNQLVYGNPFCIWFDTGEPPELAYGLFPTSIKTNVIDPFFNMITVSFGLFLLLAMLIAGLKNTSSTLRNTRFSLVEEMSMYFFAGFLLLGYWMIIDNLFLMNWSIVTSLNELLRGEGLSLGSVVMVASIDEFHFADIIVMLAEWVLMLFLNMVYILRVFTIAVLMCLGGPAIVGMLFEKTRKFFKMWFMALVGAIFMQSVHALYFTIVLLFISLNEASFIFKMFLLIMFLPLSSMIIGMMQMADAALETKTTQSMVNTAAVASRFGGKGKNMMNGKNGANPKMSELKDTRISSLAKGGSGWAKAKGGLQAAGSMAGLAAGSVIGAGGASLGSQLGGKVMGTAMQAPRNIAAGIKGVVDTNKAFKGSDLAQNISDRRSYFGQMGESIGTVFGQGDIGRKVGNIASGVSDQRLLNSNELGGLGGVTMQDIFSKYPEATIQYQQTNEGSAFFMNHNGEFQPVSPMGAADTTLPDGFKRTIDYRFTDSFKPDQAVSNQTSDLLNSAPLLTKMSDVQIHDAQGQSMFDHSFNPNRVQPDDYFAKGNPTADTRTTSDKFADFIGDYRGGGTYRE